ncbi:MAG: membrane protein insertion efficiency factor YidD [Alphaproteobacteria bacterium]|nr:membrane protein insertion efficiency factor YidD [Alphaproteobacteria bacterium]
MNKPKYSDISARLFCRFSPTCSAHSATNLARMSLIRGSKDAFCTPLTAFMMRTGLYTSVSRGKFGSPNWTTLITLS